MKGTWYECDRNEHATQVRELSDSELASVAGGWRLMGGATWRNVMSKGGTPSSAEGVTYGEGLTPEQLA